MSSAAEMDIIIHNKQISIGFPVKSRLVLVINKRNYNYVIWLRVTRILNAMPTRDTLMFSHT